MNTKHNYDVVEIYEVRVYSDGAKLWFQNEQLHRVDGPAMEWNNGNYKWYQEGKLHRVGGPAVVTDRYEGWYQNNELHRDDGPAVDDKTYGKSWYQNGLLHREDGPAVERINGQNQYWIHGKLLTKEEFNNRNKVKELTIGQIEELLGHQIKIIK